MELSQDHSGEITKRRSVAGLKLIETSYSPQTRLPKHQHERACLCIVLRGLCHETYPRQTFACHPFSLLFRPAEESHSDYFDSGVTRTLIVELDGSWLNRVRDHDVRLDGPVYADNAIVKGLAARLRSESQETDTVATLAIEGLTFELAAEISRCAIGGGERTPAKWLSRVKDFLHAHFSESLTLTDLATVGDVHPVHLAREFRRYYRCTIGEYVRRLRIEFACSELAGTNIPLVEIGLAAGVVHQAHFSRSFKQITSMTPAQYRAITRAC